MSEEEVKTTETSTETVGANIDEGIPPEIIRPERAVKRSESLGGLDLDPETIEQLKGKGVYMDGLSPLKGKKKDTEQDEPKKKTDSEDESEDGKSKEADESEESQEGQPKKSEEAEDKDKGDEDKEKEPTFIDKVNEQLKDLGDEERTQFLDELNNWTKYTKSNTEKAQKLSEREKSLGDVEVAHAFAKFLNTEKVLNLIDVAQKNKDVIENVLTQLDEGFFSDDENPEANILRQIYSLFTESAVPTQTYTKQQQEHFDKEAELMLDEEIIELKGKASEYVDEEKLKELLQFAADEDVSLIQAHKLKSVENGQDELAKSKKEVKTLNDELIKVKEELENLKKKAPNYTKKKVIEGKEEEEIEPQTMGTRAAEIATMDDTEKGVRKKLGLD